MVIILIMVAIEKEMIAIRFVMLIIVVMAMIRSIVRIMTTHE